MVIPNYSAKTRKIGVIHENDSAVISTPNQLTLFRVELFFTKYTVSHWKNVNENGI
jgi:hypothetical protein